MQIPFYKRDPIRYRAVHQWLNTNHRKPSACNHCGKTDCRIEWANISGEYKQDRGDFLALCSSCHRRWDNGKLQIGDIGHFDHSIPQETRRLMKKIHEVREIGKVSPRREYTLKELIEIRAFPFITGGDRHQYREYAAIIQDDMIGENIIGAVRIPQGQRGSYQVPGAGILKFLKIYGPGLKLAKQRIWKQKRS